MLFERLRYHILKFFLLVYRRKENSQFDIGVNLQFRLNFVEELFPLSSIRPLPASLNRPLPSGDLGLATGYSVNAIASSTAFSGSPVQSNPPFDPTRNAGC